MGERARDKGSWYGDLTKNDKLDPKDILGNGVIILRKAEQFEGRV